MHFAVLSEVHNRRNFTAYGIACDDMGYIARLFKGFKRNLILVLTQILYTTWNNRSNGAILTNIRGRAVSYADMYCRDQLCNKLTGKGKSKKGEVFPVHVLKEEWRYSSTHS